MYIKQNIEESLFKNELTKLINLPITSVWNGINNSIGLEIGELHEEGYSTTVKGHIRNFVGDWTLFISGEWQISGHKNTEKVIKDISTQSGTQKLVGLKIKDLLLDVERNLVNIYLSKQILLSVRKGDMGLVGMVYNHKRYLNYNGEDFSEIRYPNK